MYPKAVQYTDILVHYLLQAAEINAQVNEYIVSIEKNNEFIDFERQKKAEILFSFIKLTNTSITLKEAKIFALGMNKPAENVKERLYVNAQNILDYIESSYMSERFSITFFTHVNKLFLESLRDIWDVGKTMTSLHELDIQYELPVMKIPVLQSDSLPYLHGLETYYQSSTQPEMVKFITIFNTLIHSPLFAIGNDVTAMAVLLYMFKRQGWNQYINFFACIKRVIDTTKTMDRQDFFKMFPELFTHMLTEELLDLRATLQPFLEQVRIDHAKFIDLTARQVKGLSYLKEKEIISREIYAKLNDISAITSYRDLNDMLKKGYIHVTGIGKGTKYIL